MKEGRPESDGYYWYESDEPLSAWCSDEGPTVCLVQTRRGKMEAAFVDFEVWTPLDELTGRFYGPLPLPPGWSTS